MTTSIFYKVLKEYLTNNQTCVICINKTITFPNCTLLDVTNTHVRFICDTPEILYDYNLSNDVDEDDDDVDVFDSETWEFESKRIEMTIRTTDIYFVGRVFNSVRKQIEMELCENVSSESS